MQAEEKTGGTRKGRGHYGIQSTLEDREAQEIPATLPKYGATVCNMRAAY